MTISDKASATAALLAAEDSITARGRITDEWASLDVPTAYEIQGEIIAARVAQGRTVIGTKLGLTSKAKQVRMGISSPLIAKLLDNYLLEEDASIPLDKLIHPRVEPEIVFVMGEDLRGPNVTAAQALAAVKTVHAGAEVIDSRYIDYSFALPDVLADNASSAFFFMSSRGVAPSELDLRLEAVALSVNGKCIATATGAAVQGNPAEALALAANELATRGEYIKAGEIVLTGGLTDAVPVSAGMQISAEFTTLGSLFMTAE
jgi:2-oxo-3-hexenedioate decarboxylase